MYKKRNQIALKKTNCHRKENVFNIEIRIIVENN
jgi:hypothetical protein